MRPHFPLRLTIHTPTGIVPLTPQRASVQLPRGPDSDGPVITYGPYLRALSRFLAEDSFRPLLEALHLHLGRPIDPRSIDDVEIISRKHGALYHVAQVRVTVSGTICSFALNVAVRPDQQAFLEAEYGLLHELHRRFGLPFLPRPYALGDVSVDQDRGMAHSLKLFLAEWFDNFHEFHLSSEPERHDSPTIRLWGPPKGQDGLNASQTRSLYSQMAAILTGYFDERSFEQIYPWHHAAGDFVVRKTGDDVQLRLITARDYRSLTPLGPDPAGRWIAIAHFFLNMTIRLRLDRLDGTGPLTWASEQSLQGVIEGFALSWAQKAKRDPTLPSPGEVIQVLRSFTPEDWLPLAEILLDGCLVEADEGEFLQPRLPEHVDALAGALQGYMA